MLKWDYPKVSTTSSWSLTSAGLSGRIVLCVLQTWGLWLKHRWWLSFCNLCKDSEVHVKEHKGSTGNQAVGLFFHLAYLFRLLTQTRGGVLALASSERVGMHKEVLYQSGCLTLILLEEALSGTTGTVNSSLAGDLQQSLSCCLTSSSPCVCILSSSFNILTVIHGLMLSSDLISMFCLGSPRSSVIMVSCLGQTPTKHALMQPSILAMNKLQLLSEKHFL